jgi:putative SOS response-associated peptidase YedK
VGKPAFREALSRRRCLIPADGFYEWAPGHDRTTVPYFVQPVDQPVFAFAGLWEAWRDPTDPRAAPLRTCTILTTVADARLARLHARMPVVLPPSAWDAWLDRGRTEVEAARGLLPPALPGAVSYHPVSREVNTPRNNHPGSRSLLALLPPTPDRVLKLRPRAADRHRVTTNGVQACRRGTAR